MNSPETEHAHLLRTLDAIAAEDPINDWIFSRIRPHLGNRVLEVGCGIGTFTRRLVEVAEVVAIDPLPQMVDRCRAALDGRADFRVGGIEDVHADLASRFDSAVCLNVLEHIEDDASALWLMRDLLRPGGRLLLLVPAGPRLYGSLDEAFGHWRRYRREGLAARLENAGFVPEEVGYFNLLGVPGWLVASKVLRHNDLRRGLLRAYRLLMPPFRWVEDRFSIPFGLSILAVARKPGAGG